MISGGKTSVPGRRGLGIFPKILLSYLLLSIIPVVVLGILVHRNMAETGVKTMAVTKETGEKNLLAATAIGRQAIEDSVFALDEKATEAIEVRTEDLAHRIAGFLYERDRDLVVLSSFTPDAEKLFRVYQSLCKEVILPSEAASRGPAERSPARVTWENVENSASWRHRPPDNFQTVSKPLYKEITFVDLSGREKIKIADGRISDDLRDVSRPENTYCRAEDYFSHLAGLGRGEIYVSRVIGPYLPGWLEKTDQGLKVKPESAYAGRENPGGRRFEGIVRWATPVYDGDRKIGYLTLALDHAHLMEFTDHLAPTEERFTDMPDGGSGNYAFLWDDQDQCISHPRDFFICGYDPETGLEVPGWISQETYNEYKESGLGLLEFIRGLPDFRNFSQTKPGSSEQATAGRIALDCRILDTAPQCQGWHRGTEDGGSGSFLLLWSGLWKLTTYAAVPYYTGRYGASRRGFGYVTIGANVDDFHKAADVTKAKIEESIRQQGNNIASATFKAEDLIENHSRRNSRQVLLVTLASTLGVIFVSIFLGLAITRPLKRLTEGAEAISRGELNQHIEVSSGDELGKLARSFNDMAAAVAEVDRMKSEFVTIASHELRTPIHAMLLGLSGILGGYSGEVSEEVREDLKIVNDGVTRLRSLVETLLDLSRIEARKIELNLTDCSAEEVIGKALVEVSQLVDEHHHKIEWKAAEGLPDLHADKERLIQVLINLLSNSIKYTPDHGHIIIEADISDGEMTFLVADNGYGIPAWAQNRVFDTFFQADAIMSQRVGGSGLGLSISKGIIEEHGGGIRFESPVPEGSFADLELGGERRGTIFIFHIPIKGDR